MKKVIVTAYACCPNLGSEAGNGWNWVINYINNGFSVTCITSAIYKREIEEYLAQSPINSLNFIFADSAISFSTFKIPVLGNYVHYYWWIVKARKVIREMTSQVSYVHAHHVTYSSIKFGTPLYDLNCDLILGPLGGSNLPHRSLNKYLGSYYYYEHFKNNMSYLFAKMNSSVGKSIRDAKVVLTSNEIAEDLIRKYADKPTVRMFDAGLSDYFRIASVNKELSGTVKIFWTGTMFPRKGLNLAIDAISRLPQDFDYHFTIIGDGQWRSRVETQVKDLKLTDRVTFTGHVPHFEAMRIMSESHVLLFPSLIDSCPTQIFESFALGVPVVTLNHQGMKDQVAQGKTGLKVEVKDNQDYPAELAKAILSITSDAIVYREYSRAAFEFGQQQMWSSRISAFLESLSVQNEILVH